MPKITKERMNASIAFEKLVGAAIKVLQLIDCKKESKNETIFQNIS